MDQVMPISLDDHLAEFVQTQLREGRFSSASEVVREALLLLQEERKYAALIAAIEEGEASGEPQPFDMEAFIASKQ